MPGFEHDVLNLECAITRWQREAVDQVRARLAGEQRGELFAEHKTGDKQNDSTEG